MPIAAFVTVSVVVVLLACLTAIWLTVLLRALRHGGRREDAFGDVAVVASRFTAPVSIIVPVRESTETLSQTLSSVMSLNYPQVEVIVVADDIGHEEFEAVSKEWELAPKEYFYRRALSTSPVHRIEESRRDERLIVVHKERAGFADALNCGISFARFRYVALVPTDVVLAPNGLLQLMMPALRDPATVLAAAGCVERRLRIDAHSAGSGVLKKLVMTAGLDWQYMRSMRSWLSTRVDAGGWRPAVPPDDIVAVWRRDALLENGGFRAESSDPVLDSLLRCRSTERHSDTEDVAVSTQIVGRIERARFLDGARLGRRDVLLPVARTTALALLIIGAAIGWFSWSSIVFLVLAFAFATGAITAAALLVRGALPDGPSSAQLARLLVMAPLEYVVHRPAMALFRLRAATFPRL